MNHGVMGVVAVERMHKRVLAAVAAVRAGRPVSERAVRLLLEDMVRMIASHETLAARHRAAVLALDGRAHTDARPPETAEP